jgi:hypothetical protein
VPSHCAAHSEPVGPPSRRRVAAWVEAPDDAPGKATTQIGALILTGSTSAVGNWYCGEYRGLQRCSGQRRDLTRHTVDAQAMRQVGRELESEQGVVQLEVLADIQPDRSIGSEFKQTCMSSDSLSSRAEHNMPKLSTPRNLPTLIKKGLTIIAWRQHGTHRGARHLDARTRIGCATDNAQQLWLTHIHLANAQAIGIGMLRPP